MLNEPKEKIIPKTCNGKPYWKQQNYQCFFEESFHLYIFIIYIVHHISKMKDLEDQYAFASTFQLTEKTSL